MTPRRTCVALTLAGLLAFPATGAAHADPGDGADHGTTQADVDAAHRAVTAQEARVAALQKQLDTARTAVDQAHERAEVAAEKANMAKELLKQKTAAATAARAAAEVAAQRAAASQGTLEDMAAKLYMEGGPVPGFAWLFTSGSGDIARDQADIEAAKGHRSMDLTDKRTAQAQATAAQAKAVAAQAAQKKAAEDAAAALTEAQTASDDAEKQASALAVKEKKLVAELASLRRTSVQVEQRRQAQLEREAAAREAAQVRARVAAAARAEAARAAALRQAQGPAAQAPAPTDLPAPDSQAAATAIAFAKAQLGKPYLWGGNGPNAFDCSGLTLGAWTAAGRTLPRVAQWQFSATTHVPISDLKPGDLVFFGSSDTTIHHVGLYVGGGQMIEAPRTGLNIRYSSIYRSSLRPYGGRV